MRRSLSLFSVVALGLMSATAALASPRVSFIMPAGVDPITKLFFNSNGQQLSFFGKNLLPGQGVELHQDPNSRFVINRLQFAPKGTFNTQFFIDSFGGDGTCMPLTTPWSGPSGQTTFNFQLQTQLGSTRIGDVLFNSCTQTRGPSFASMILTNADGLQQAFGDEEFFVTAYGDELATPEGSSLWMLLAGLPVLGFMVRLKRMKAQPIKP